MYLLLQQDIASNDPAGPDAATVGDSAASTPPAGHHSHHHTLTDAGQSGIHIYYNPLINSSLLS